MEEQDEEKKDKGGEQSNADKAVEAVQDTTNAVKDGASLAKNIASQNYVGIAKDAVNLLKNKQVRRVLLASILAPIIIIALVAASLFAIFNAVGEAIEEAINNSVAWFKNNYEYGAIYYTSDQLDAIIDSIQNLGINLDDLNLIGDVDYEEDDPKRDEKEREALKKYLVKFLVAQERLRTLNPGDNNLLDPRDWDNLFAERVLRNEVFLAGYGQNELIYGNVKVLRTFDKDVDNKKQLEYQFYGGLKDGDGNLKITDNFYNNQYTVDSSGNLVFAKKVKTETVVEKNVDGKKKKETTKETKYELETIDYRTVVDQYTTSVQFFIYLTMVTQNPEFASAVAEMAEKGEIQLVIMDDKVESKIVKKEEYIENTQTVSSNLDDSEVSEAGDESGESDESSESGESDESSTEEEYTRENTTSSVTETTTITEERDSPKVNIIYVDTWYAKQSITYTKNESETTSEENETIDDEEKPEDLPLTEPGEVSWITNHTITTQETTKKTEYTASVYGDVQYKTDEFIELLDKKYHIPKTMRSESPANNFVSGVDWLLELMSMDSKSQKLEKVIKLIVNKYTNSTKYEVTNLENLIDGEVTIDSTEEYFEEGGIQTEEERQKMQNKIEKELINTQVHYKDSNNYQSGPFAKWWGNQKNPLDKFQCTWWTFGRALMYLEDIESSVTSTELRKLAGNGGQWYDLNVQANVFNYGSVPKPNSIISWKSWNEDGTESYGHVAYVEGVTSDGIYISHAGNAESWFGITKIGLDGNVGWSGYTFNGYIYLDEPIT